MFKSVAQPLPDALVIRCETPAPRMAKAELPDLTLREKRAEWGAILRRCRELAKFDQQQTADELRVDRAMVSRWESGDENAHAWRYQQHPRLRLTLIEAQAEATDEADVTTTIRIRRQKASAT